MRFDMRRADYQGICRSTIPNKPTEQLFPNAASCPSHEADIGRCRRTIDFGTIGPAAPTLEHVHDATDNPAIIHSLLATNIRRQMQLDPFPLLLVQPEQIPAHGPESLAKTKQYRIVRTEGFLSSDPTKGTFRLQ